MTKQKCTPIIPFNQDKNAPPEPWLDKLNKINESGNSRIGTICGTVQYLARRPLKKRSMYDEIMDDLSSIKNDPDKLNTAIDCIEEVYQKVFCTENAEIIPFPKVAGGAI